MKQVPIKLGPVALLLTVMTICLTVMAILTVSTAGADRTMAAMFADTTQIRYTLERDGQEFLQQADEVLAAGGQLTDLPGAKPAAGGPEGAVEKTIEENEYQLTIRLEPGTGGDYRVTAWTLEKEWEEDQQMNIWQGQ